MNLVLKLSDYKTKGLLPSTQLQKEIRLGYPFYNKSLNDARPKQKGPSFSRKNSSDARSKPNKSQNSQYCHIIHWNQAQNGFVIADPQKFTNNILPMFFKHKNMHSYIRQLNMYGFSKKRDHSHNYYHHPFFLKNRPELINQIQRKVENKGQKRSKQSVASLDTQIITQQPHQTLLKINYLLLLQQAANLQLIINELQPSLQCQQLKSATFEYLSLHDRIIKKCKRKDEKGLFTAQSLLEKQVSLDYNQEA